jgi:hypothetical protein
MGFYEAAFVKTRCEDCFFLILIDFGRFLTTSPLLRLWCLIAAVRGTSAAMIKRQSQLLFAARNAIGSRRATE